MRVTVTSMCPWPSEATYVGCEKRNFDFGAANACPAGRQTAKTAVDKRIFLSVIGPCPLGWISTHQMVGDGSRSDNGPPRESGVQGVERRLVPEAKGA